MIKKWFLMATMLVGLSFGAFAQKYASVNTEYIMKNIPDYAQALAQLEKQSSDWQKELEAKFAEIDKMYKTYQQEAYLLPDNLKRKREEEIIAKEKEVKELQRKRFGADGDLDKKRQELLKPIQEKVYNAIERIANEKNYAFVFDKSASNTVLFASSRYDISDDVLEMLGYSSSNPADNTPTPAANSNKKKSDRITNPEMKKPY